MDPPQGLCHRGTNCGKGEQGWQMPPCSKFLRTTTEECIQHI